MCKYKYFAYTRIITTLAIIAISSLFLVDANDCGDNFLLKNILVFIAVTLLIIILNINVYCMENEYYNTIHQISKNRCNTYEIIT